MKSWIAHHMVIAWKITTTYGHTFSIQRHCLLHFRCQCGRGPAQERWTGRERMTDIRHKYFSCQAFGMFIVEKICSQKCLPKYASYAMKAYENSCHPGICYYELSWEMPNYSQDNGWFQMSVQSHSYCTREVQKFTKGKFIWNFLMSDGFLKKKEKEIKSQFWKRELIEPLFCYV